MLETLSNASMCFLLMAGSLTFIGVNVAYIRKNPTLTKPEKVQK